MSNSLFRRFSIAARIVGAALAFCAFLVISSMISLSTYNQVYDRLRQLNDAEIPIERLILRAVYAIDTTELEVEKARAGIPSNLDAALGELDSARAGLVEVSDLLSKAGEQSQDIMGALDNLEQYRTELVAFQAALDTGNLGDVNSLFQNIESLAPVLHDSLIEILQARQAASETTNNNILAAAQNRILALNAALVGLIFLAILLALLAARTITRPLSEIRIAAEGFRFGQRDIQLSEQGQDEISDLSKTINRLFSQLKLGYDDIEQRVTERTAALAQRAAHIQTATELAREVAGSTDVYSVLDWAVNLLHNRFGFYFVGIFLLDMESQFLVLKAGTGEAGRVLKSRGFRIHISEASLVSYAASNGEIRVVNDVETEFIHRKEVILPLTGSEAVLPMRAGGRVIGVLDIQNTNRNTFSSEQVAILQFIGDLLGISVENARLAGSLKEAQDEIQTLYKRYTERSWLQEKTSGKTIGYQYNLMELGSADFELDPGLEEQLKTGLPVIVPGVGQDADHSILLAPIMMYNQVVGVIGLEEDQVERSWTQDEKEILLALTSQIALTLENARLLEESQHRSTQLRLLQEVTAAAAAHTDLVELLDHVAQTLRAGLGLPYVGAVMFDPGMVSGLEITGVSSTPDSAYSSMRSQTWLLHDNLAVDRLLESKETQIIEQAQSNVLTRTLHTSLARAGTQTLILVPINYRGAIIGLIDLHVDDPGRTFTEDDRQLLNQVSLQLSSAVEVARSFEEANLRADREKQISSVIQRIRESLDIPTILRTAAHEIRNTLAVPEVTVRLVSTSKTGDAQAPENEPTPQAQQGIPE